MKPLLFLSLVCGLVLTGCATETSHKLPNVDLTKYKTAFVVHLLADGHQTDELIGADLRERGFTVAVGPLTMLPDNTDLLVEYRDNWAWDFKNYMIGIDVQVKETKTDRVLATASIDKPSMVMGESPKQLVHNVLSTIFKK